MDSLKDYDFGSDKGGGLFLKFKDGEEVKLKVLTTDPVVNKDKWGNIRFSFIVYNLDQSKAMVLSKGSSIAKELQKLHNDQDFGADIRNLDIKIITEGEGMETRYSVQPLPKSTKLTKEQIAEAAKINLDELIGNGIRMSKLNEGDTLPEAEAPAEESSAAPEEVQGYDPVVEVDPDEEIDLSSIPF